jgi:hypothetical protein
VFINLGLYGEPYPDVKVEFQGQTTTTNSRGAFNFYVMQYPGTYHIKFTHPKIYTYEADLVIQQGYNWYNITVQPDYTTPGPFLRLGLTSP